jgi:hypothetical protein
VSEKSATNENQRASKNSKKVSGLTARYRRSAPWLQTYIYTENECVS